MNYRIVVKELKRQTYACIECRKRKTKCSMLVVEFEMKEGTSVDKGGCDRRVQSRGGGSGRALIDSRWAPLYILHYQPKTMRFS